jgi:hypothetical protein
MYPLDLTDFAIAVPDHELATSSSSPKSPR